MQIKVKMKAKINFFKTKILKFYDTFKDKKQKYLFIKKILFGIILYNIFVMFCLFVIEFPLLTQELNSEFVQFINSLNLTFLLITIITIIVGIILYIYAEFKLYKSDKKNENTSISTGKEKIEGIERRS